MATCDLESIDTLVAWKQHYK